MKKRIIAAILAAVFIFTTASLVVVADDTEVTDIEDVTSAEPESEGEASGDPDDSSKESEIDTGEPSESTDESEADTGEPSESTGDSSSTDTDEPTDEPELSVQEIVYQYLTEELDLCPAAAAGVMGNIMIECSFDPSTLAMDVNNKYSFGLMMWNGSRYEALKKWCDDNGFEYEDPRGQLGYLRWELENTETGAYMSILDIPNTIEGAARAAVVWASEFERCTRTSYGLRIYYALNMFWPEYADGTVSSTPGIYGYYYNVPKNIKQGESLRLYGAVVSYSSKIKSMTVGVFTEDGELVTGRTVEQDSLACNIGVVDRFVVFNKVPAGNYYYTITAENADGEYIVDRRAFTVTDEPTEAELVYESEGGVICENGASCPGLNFTDMPPAVDWSHSGIDYVLNAGLFKGEPNGIFAPYEDMNRAMFVTVLKRLYEKYDLENYVKPAETEEDSSDVTEPWSADSESEVTQLPVKDSEPTYILPVEPTPTPVPMSEDGGETNETEAATDTDTAPTEPGTSGAEEEEPIELPFTDVHEDEWFFDAVMWAHGEGLTYGKGDGIFDPLAPLTRAELATLLYRFAEKYGLDTSARAGFEAFADTEEVEDWAQDALSWAVAEGLVNGSLEYGTLYLDPQGHATRAQVAAITERFAAFVERT